MKRIIIADDHHFIRLGLIQILKDEYPQVFIREVGDGDSLLYEVSQEEWDLVISDLDMPGKNGLEALIQIKKIKPLLPVLILTIYTEDLYAIRVLKAGAAGYMNKNTAPYELIQAIQQISLGKKYIPAEMGEKLLQYINAPQRPHELLTNKEFEIFKLLVNGNTITEIAERLSLALTTVSTHRTRIMEKLQVTTNTALIRYAIANQLISDIAL